jgi:hypothetical protein
MPLASNQWWPGLWCFVPRVDAQVERSWAWRGFVTSPAQKLSSHRRATCRSRPLAVAARSATCDHQGALLPRMRHPSGVATVESPPIRSTMERCNINQVGVYATASGRLLVRLAAFAPRIGARVETNWAWRATSFHLIFEPGTRTEQSSTCQRWMPV